MSHNKTSAQIATTCNSKVHKEDTINFDSSSVDNEVMEEQDDINSMDKSMEDNLKIPKLGKESRTTVDMINGKSNRGNSYANISSTDDEEEAIDLDEVSEMLRQKKEAEQAKKDRFLKITSESRKGKHSNFTDNEEEAIDLDAVTEMLHQKKEAEQAKKDRLLKITSESRKRKHSNFPNIEPEETKNKKNITTQHVSSTTYENLDHIADCFRRSRDITIKRLIKMKSSKTQTHSFEEERLIAMDKISKEKFRALARVERDILFNYFNNLDEIQLKLVDVCTENQKEKQGIVYQYPKKVRVAIPNLGDWDTDHVIKFAILPEMLIRLVQETRGIDYKDASVAIYNGHCHPTVFHSQVLEEVLVSVMLLSDDYPKKLI